MNLAEPMPADPLVSNRDLFEQMIRSFESAGMPYCILAGYDTYPHLIPSDIDFMVHPKWVKRLPGIINAIAAGTGAHLIQSIRHETTAAYFVLARRDGAKLTYLHPDSSSDYRRRSRLWLRAETVLENRRRHPQGFWIPSAADAFAYYLIKKLDKASLDDTQAQQLALRYAEDPHACNAVLHELLPKPEASVIEAAVRTASPFASLPWSAVNEGMDRLRPALSNQPTRESAGARLRQAVRDLGRVLMRCRRPTGMSIVFLGPDGCGKSSVIAQVSEQLSQAFRQVEYRHLRPGALPRTATAPVVDPHGRPPRGLPGSLAKLLYFWTSYLVGSVAWLYPRRVRSTLVVFDRYYQDILADPRRYRYSAPLPLARLLGRWLPQPDMVFILDAPAEALQSRKQEVPFAESARQRNAYLELSTEFRQASVIDASKPLDQVVATVLGHVIDFLEQRTARRLRIR